MSCINDDDRLLINKKRGNHNRLGFALQLGTVRFLGRFLDDPINVPSIVLQMIAKQLEITDINNLKSYCAGEQRWIHANEIRNYYEYCDITDHKVGFRFTRWLCSLCWTGTNRPSVLFDRAKNWLLTHKILLPGISVLERLIARVRNCMEKHLCFLLVQEVTSISPFHCSSKTKTLLHLNKLRAKWIYFNISLRLESYNVSMII